MKLDDCIMRSAEYVRHKEAVYSPVVYTTGTS
jgi:hypothetical protein